MLEVDQEQLKSLAELFSTLTAENSWMALGRCATGSQDPDLWFTEKGHEDNSAERIRLAKRICKVCPVNIQCRDYAVENGIQEGIWGGMTSRERGRYIKDNAIQVDPVKARPIDLTPFGRGIRKERA